MQRFGWPFLVISHLAADLMPRFHGSVAGREVAAFVGRAQELAVLSRHAQTAARGHGGFVVVRGEAGVGKSRLLAEMRVRAEALGMASAVGRATEEGCAYRPLADVLLMLQRDGRLPSPTVVEPFARVLGSLVPGWAQPAEIPAWDDRSLLVSEGLLRLLRAVSDSVPILVLLDDLHWVDVDTLAVLDRLTDVIGETRALFVLAAREQSPDPLAGLSRRSSDVLRLPRLSLLEAATLADHCGQGHFLSPGFRDRLVERAEGLPLLVEELVGAWVGRRDRSESDPSAVSAVPRSIAAVVQGHLASLDPQARRVVEAASVIGRQIAWRPLIAATGLSEQAVVEAVQSAVNCGLFSVRSEPPATVQFHHALTREAVLAQVLLPVRASFARQAAQALEEWGEDALLAASLHEQAGDRRAAARLLVHAGQDPAGALGTREAVLRRAARLVPDDDDPALALVQVLVLAGRAEEAREVGDPLLEKLREGDPRRGELALTLARACHVAAHPGEARRYLRVAGGGDAVGALAAHVAFAQQRPKLAQRLASAVVQSPHPEVRCEALEILGRIARLQGHRAEAERAFTEALAVARRHELTAWKVRALHECGTLDLLGPARTDRLEAARELALRSGQLATAAVLDVQLAAVHGLRMDHPATVTAATRAVELAEALRLPAVAGAGMVFLATARGHAGEVEEMHALLEQAERRLGDDPDKLAAARLARATPAMLAHDLPRWHSALEEGMDLLRRNPTASPSPFRGLYALLETVLGEGAVAREELRASGVTVQACNEGALAYADAVAVGRTGQDPARHLRRAEAAMGPLTWRRHHMHLLVAPQAFEHGWGSPEQWLREAEDHFTSSGDVALAAACRRSLRTAGVAVPRRGRGDSVVPPQLRRHGVTSREMDVLLLLAAGLTNREVAERLVLSARTIETHIGSLLAKTGAANRADLMAHVTAAPQPPS